PGALEMMVTYPFPQAATGAVQGDFTNLRITADLDLRTILSNLGGPKPPDLPTVPNPTGSPLPIDPTNPLPIDPPSLPVTPPSLPVTPPSGGTGGGTGGGTCVAGICIGAPARASAGAAGAYDTNLAALMLGGLT
ncbi:MAG: MCE family protein, partial [Actinomycetes bacterium]